MKNKGHEKKYEIRLFMTSEIDIFNITKISHFIFFVRKNFHLSKRRLYSSYINLWIKKQITIYNI